MDRNTIIGLVVIAGILVLYSLFTRPSQEELAEQKRRQDSIVMVQEQQRILDSLDLVDRIIKDHQQRTGTTANIPASEPGQGQVIDQQASVEQNISLFGAFAEGASGEKKFITLENDRIIMRVSTLGGRIYSVQLKDYQTHDSLPLILFNGDSTVFGMKFFAQNRSINTNELFFTPDTDENYLDASGRPASLSMKLSAGDGSYIEYVYTLSPEDWMVGFDMNFINMGEIISTTNNFIDLNWSIFVPPQEKGRINEWNYTTMVFKHYQDDVERFNARTKKELQEKEIPTRIKWYAFKQQFFASVLIADDYFSNGSFKSNKFEEEDPFLKTFESTIGIPYQAGEQVEYKMTFYFGPTHFNTLKAYEMDMEEMINLGGMFSRVINRYMIIPVFSFLNKSITSYGLIILLLTLMIKLILFPLTYRSYMSMAKMRTLKPEIDAINEKIPKEKSMERQQATMALYKKAGVSPLGGCLPVVLQMPILISMFRFFPTSIELRQQSFLWAHDLSTYDSILNLPFTIPMYGDHVSLFTLLMTASTILTMKISNQATAGQSQMPGMKGMMYIMPVMFMFMLNNWSSALTYYYFLANIITFGQNQLVKQFVDEEALRNKLKLNQKKSAGKKKKSGFQKRLEDMAKQRGYQAKKK
jgi:YidC/Oxa1 family membrane protein insertase